MMGFVQKILTNCLLCVVLALSFPVVVNAATLEELETRINRLEQTLEKTRQTLEEARQALEEARQGREKLEEVVKAAPIRKKDDAANVYLDGTFWPSLTYRDADSHRWVGMEGSSTDVYDVGSKIGIAADVKVTDTLTAVLRGVWAVNINDEGDLGRRKLAYVGLKSSDYGSVLIGTQYDPHYSIVAGVVDVFYNFNSPFGYIQDGPYYTDNQISYAHNIGGFKVGMGVKVNGKTAGKDDPREHRHNPSDESVMDVDGKPTGTKAPRHVDAASFGVGYRYGPAYLGVSYLRAEGETVERDYFGVGGSWDVTDDLYLAFTYQNIVRDPENAEDQEQYTLDLLASYSFGNGYTGLAAFFAYDDDVDGAGSTGVVGQNLTLFKALTSNVGVFAEYLREDFENPGKETVNTLSLGIKYGFKAQLY